MKTDTERKNLTNQTADQTLTGNLIRAKAIATFISRRDRLSQPSGDFDNGGRWTPNDEEWRTCCHSIRRPSAACPYSLLLHCRTAKHIARLHSSNESEIRAIAGLCRSRAVKSPNYYVLLARFDADVRSPAALILAKTLILPEGITDAAKFLAQSTLLRILAEHIDAPLRQPMVELLARLESTLTKGEFQLTREACSAHCKAAVVLGLKVPSEILATAL